MPWKVMIPMEARLRFVLLVVDDLKSFSAACVECGISRRIGYKWWKRYRLHGAAGLKERSHRPVRSPHQTSSAWVDRILAVRKRHRHWGPKKIRVCLLAASKGEAVPASSTIGRILASVGLVRARGKRRPRGPVVVRAGLTQPLSPNHVWAVDFKGWFRLGNGERCEPLTVSDLASRYVLCCWGGSDVSYDQARPVFERVFKKYGQPAIIRVDNGPPFGSVGAAGMGRLAVWWVSLGIRPEYITPGHPEQNPSHERMHRTLKAEGIKPIAHHRKKQQRRLESWRREFNDERPHEALGQVTPASVYQVSAVGYGGPQEPVYPSTHVVRRVRSNGEIRWGGTKRFIGEAFVGQSVGIVPGANGEQLIYFHDHLLGEIGEKGWLAIKPVVVVRAR